LEEGGDNRYPQFLEARATENALQIRAADFAPGLKRPPPQVLEDATDDPHVFDSSAMTRIGPLHFEGYSVPQSGSQN